MSDPRGSMPRSILTARMVRAMLALATLTIALAASIHQVPRPRPYLGATLGRPNLSHAAMRKAGLDSNWQQTVVDLATGQLPLNTLRCCGSGCKPCVQDVQRCVARVVQAWNDPDFEEKLLEAADRSISRRAKRVARRALRKFGV